MRSNNFSERIKVGPLLSNSARTCNSEVSLSQISVVQYM